MSWLSRTLNSSIGQKITMSITGLFLCLFLVIHLIGNLQLLNDDSGYSFNKYAKFMTSNPLIMIVSYVNYFAILYHAFKGLHLAYKNAKARPVKYRANRPSQNSAWMSRSMGILGTFILVFIVIHMQQFWFEYKFGNVPYANYAVMTIGDNQELLVVDSNYKQKVEALQTKYEPYFTSQKEAAFFKKEDFRYKDLSTIVGTTFKQPWYVALYVFSMAIIAFHLFHGFKSAFQTLGLSHIKYNTFISRFGVVFSLLIPAGFAAIPLIYYFVK